MRIALIGSRQLEQKEEYFEDIKLCYNVCMILAQLGITFTSGLCELGMDGIAQKAYSKAVDLGYAKESQFEVYVADQYNIKKSNLPRKHLAITRNKDLIAETERIASEVHPAWDRCNEWARGMHSRNCHQILGYDLQHPVDAVICWTPRGNIQGGTATAIRIAIKYNIPVFNLGVKNKSEVLNQIKLFLENKGG
ncbi:MAG: hypothetical protein RSB94_07135 [Erysipelotrichaceae bacterium]